MPRSVDPSAASAQMVVSAKPRAAAQLKLGAVEGTGSPLASIRIGRSACGAATAATAARAPPISAAAVLTAIRVPETIW